MDASEIQISGNQFLITKTPGSAYRVVSGHVLVFVVPLSEDDVPGRRWLLCELKSGDIVPTLYHTSSDLKGAICRWSFGLSALEPATLEIIEDSTELHIGFAKKFELRDYEIIGFEESAVETCRLEVMREQRNIFAAGENRNNTYQRSLDVIYNLFRNEKRYFRKEHELTGNALYDACVRLCDLCGVTPADLDVLTTNCGKNFTVKDLARVSGFICREIVLEENWYRSDTEPLLAYYNENGKPVVCLPQKTGKFVMWDPAADLFTPIDETVAAELAPRAMVFYRPFPNEKITTRKLLLFALKDVKWPDVSAVLFFTFVGTLVGLLTPFLNEKMYDLFIPLGDVSGLQAAGAMIIACAIGNVSFSLVKSLGTFRVLSRMKYSVQSAVIDRLFNLPESFLRTYDSADLGQRAMGFADVFYKVSYAIVGTGMTAIFSIAYLSRMFSYSSSLSLVAILMLLVVILLAVYLGNKKLKYERERVASDSESTSMMFQFLQGVSKLRIAGAENRALYQYLNRYTYSRKMGMHKETYTLLISILLGAVNTCFLIVFYGMMVGQNIHMSTGAFMGFIASFSALSAAMLALVNTILQILEALPIFERMKPILETMPEKQEEAVMPGELLGEIEVNHVSFSYSEDGPTVLKDISFRIKPGEYIGIVGSSGCGKSTLLKLLLGFETPQSGRVYYDGRDIDAMDKRELRKRLGVVLQNGGLITGSIYDNVTITSPYATKEQVEQAIRDAGLEKDIARMPMGLHTVLSEGEGSVSGGQRQRILIARAIVGKPKILFFDEATSALDNATQAAVCESLESLRVTRVAIAHRLSTIMHCDRIFVMDDGKIVEEGTYEQLMEKHGLFYRLASRQMT